MIKSNSKVKAKIVPSGGVEDVEDKSKGVGAAEAAILSLSVEDEWEETEKKKSDSDFVRSCQKDPPLTFCGFRGQTKGK
ncbi:unnamed protein product [Brassica rapa subsp. trilocularis]